MMGEIKIRELSVYAYHGCFSEERKIGSEYKLDISVKGDFSVAEKTDDLADTVDYVRISDIAKEEMATPSKLIEHVAERILSKIFHQFPKLKTVVVIIKKLNPPMNVYADAVEYKLERTR